jgi:hypothetical protein
MLAMRYRLEESTLLVPGLVSFLTLAVWNVDHNVRAEDVTSTEYDDVLSAVFVLLLLLFLVSADSEASIWLNASQISDACWSYVGGG